MKINLDYVPHKMQEKIHQACSLSKANKIRYVVIAAGRSSGKSTALIAQVLLWVYNYTSKKRKIWYVLPTESQASKVHLLFTQMLQNSNLIKRSIQTKGNIAITFNNGSILEFKSAQSGDNLRGDNTVNCLIIDEAAYVDEKIIKVLLPTMSTAVNPKIVFASSPKSKMNWLYKYYLMGLDPEQKDICSIHFTYKSNPLVDKEFVESARKAMTEKEFNVEYLAKFMDVSTVFGDYLSCIDHNIDIKSGIAAPGMQYYTGVDFALQGGDSTVLTTIDSSGKVVNIERFSKKKYPILKSIMLKVFKIYNPKKVLIEKAGMNFLYQSLKFEHKINNLEEWQTSNSDKEELINHLVGAFENGEIKIPNYKPLLDELESFVPMVTPTGKVKYCALPGFHDDCVMSLAIAWRAYVKNKHKAIRIFAG